MKNLIIVPLRHHALLSYLHSRMIDSDIGRMFCKEVHYELRQRRYFALAFGNISGGYEVRNPYYKGCIKNKDISLIPNRVVRHRAVSACLKGSWTFCPI